MHRHVCPKPTDTVFTCHRASWQVCAAGAVTCKWERPLSAGTRKWERPLRYALLARSTSNSQILRMASRNASIMVRLLLRSPRDPTLRACTHTLAHARVHMCVRTHALAHTHAHPRAHPRARTHAHTRAGLRRLCGRGLRLSGLGKAKGRWVAARAVRLLRPHRLRCRTVVGVVHGSGTHAVAVLRRRMDIAVHQGYRVAFKGVG